MAQKRKRNKKWIYWLIILVLLVAADVVVYLVWDNYFNDKADDGGQEEETEQVEDVSVQEKENEEGDSESEKPKVIQYDGEDPNTKEELSGAITYASVSGNKLMIRVNIDQYLENGECALSLIRGGGVIYNNSARIVANASTATCEGFDVLVDEIGKGAVDVMINLSAGGKNGTIRGEADV